ncbi:MAG: nitroreductase family protein [Lachnospiraceae bacterium]|nr:nitroreductase family protein [Lachnospiraceae bacterium]
MANYIEAIKNRTSIRTFDKEPIQEEHLNQLKEFMKDVPNPFNVPVSFVLLDAKEHNLSSPVLAGENCYIAGKITKQPNAEVAYGYSFEKLVLFAQSLGLGTVWIGGTMKRELFEAAAEVKDGEIMPCVTPIGYPAKKRGVKEVMMRKGVGADSRYDAKQLFFDGAWDQPLALDDEMAEIFELVRWAPSAVNKQPWRVVVKDGRCHFYEKKDKGYDKEDTGDLQKIDLGIALSHFVLGLEEKGKKVEITIADPQIAIPEGVDYIASVAIV